jgi:gas vesicle protein
MSNKKGGFFPILVGTIAGAAAVFFSDKKNREKAKKVVAKGKAQVKKLSLEAKKNPEAFARKMAKKATAQAQKLGRQFASRQK